MTQPTTARLLARWADDKRRWAEFVASSHQITAAQCDALGLRRDEQGRLHVEGE